MSDLTKLASTISVFKRDDVVLDINDNFFKEITSAVRNHIRTVLGDHLFEPNTDETQDAVAKSIRNYMLELVDRGLIVDFSMVTHASGSDLDVDVAFKPELAQHFIVVRARVGIKEVDFGSK